MSIKTWKNCNVINQFYQLTKLDLLLYLTVTVLFNYLENHINNGSYQFSFIKSQIIEYCILRTKLYQTGAHSPVFAQSLLLSEGERQSSICSLKSEITFAIIKLL